MERLCDLLERNVRSIGDKVFIVAEDETLTYTDFDLRTSKLAQVLRSRGINKRDRVGLYFPSRPIAAIGFWACQKLGAIPVPMSAMYRSTELINGITTTGMVAVITDADRYPQIAKIRSSCPSLKQVLATGIVGDDGLDQDLTRAEESFKSVRSAATDIAAIFFTSGTSGVPKGTAQSHFNQCSTLRDMMCFHRTRFAQEVYYCAAPLFTNLGMTVTVNLCMYSGGTVVMHERWNTSLVLDAIRRHRVTMLGGTPTMFVYLVNEFDPRSDDLSSLRLCTNGGAPVSPVVARRFEEISGAPVLQVYGATETLGQNVMEPAVGIRKAGSAGVAIGSSRISIIDDAGAPLPRGSVGEILISGDCVASGYWSEEHQSPLPFHPEGWLSGDLGYLDGDNYLYIVDRKKEVIITGGHNIYPLEVENILYQHPAVAVCAVLGVPDATKGEVPVAVVVLRSELPVSADDLITYCRAHLSVYKAPRQIYFTSELPITAGKIRKREILQLISQGQLEPAT